VVFVQETQTPAGTTKPEIQDENPKNLLCSTHGILRPYPVNRQRGCHGIALNVGEICWLRQQILPGIYQKGDD